MKSADADFSDISTQDTMHISFINTSDLSLTKRDAFKLGINSESFSCEVTDASLDCLEVMMFRFKKGKVWLKY